jgi:PIN domain nuclease of toxin-antitoxin system
VILLDTHVALWLLHAAERFGPRARETVASAPTVYFSSISIVETSIKRLTGRLDVPDDLPRILRAQGLVSLDLTAEHATAIERFPEIARHDPFDRLLLAQAAVEGCRLLTADPRMLALGLDRVVDART